MPTFAKLNWSIKSGGYKLKILLEPPPSPTTTHIKGGVGVGYSKSWVTWGVGVWNFLLEKGDKPENGELMKKCKVATFFTTLQFSSITFTVRGRVRLSLLIFKSSVFWVSDARFSSTFSSKSSNETWYQLYISDPFW